MTPSSTNPTVTDRGFDNLFRGCGRDDQQAVVAGSFILDTLKRDKIALIHDKDTYGQGLVDAVKKTIEARGIKPVMYEGLTRGERDFNALVTKIKSSGANAVYFGGLIPEGGPLIRQLKEQGVDVVIVSGDAFAQAELVAAAGGAQNLKNVYYSATPDPLADPSTQGVQGFVEESQHHAGKLRPLWLCQCAGRHCRAEGRRRVEGPGRLSPQQHRRFRHRQDHLGRQGRHQGLQVRLLQLRRQGNPCLGEVRHFAELAGPQGPAGLSIPERHKRGSPWTFTSWFSNCSMASRWGRSTA
ncbi:branched-chain amino acid ABC transporter substrate-binding protein [Rhizobium beringeri]